MKNKFIIGIFILTIALSLIIPKIVLFWLEDKNIDKLYKGNANILKISTTKDESIITKTIYSKYNGEKYNISTNDTYKRPTIHYEADGKQMENEELIKLQELEKIGMINNDLFSYLEKINQ